MPQTTLEIAWFAFFVVGSLGGWIYLVRRIWTHLPKEKLPRLPFEPSDEPDTVPETKLAPRTKHNIPVYRPVRRR